MSVIHQALCKHLQADAAISAVVGARIYPDVAPKGVPYPLILVSEQDGDQPQRVFQGVAAVKGRYFIRAVDRSASPKEADALAALIKNSLEGAALVVAGHTTLAVEWLKNKGYVEPDPAGPFQHRGAFYEVYVS